MRLELRSVFPAVAVLLWAVPAGALDSTGPRSFGNEQDGLLRETSLADRFRQGSEHLAVPTGARDGEFVRYAQGWGSEESSGPTGPSGTRRSSGSNPSALTRAAPSGPGRVRSGSDPSAPPPRIKGKITSNDGAKKTDLKDSAVLPARTGNRGFNSIEDSIRRGPPGTAIDRLGGGPSGGNFGKTGSVSGSRPAMSGMSGTSGESGRTVKSFGRHGAGNPSVDPSFSGGLPPRPSRPVR
jgi:hypothetical protein